MSDKNKKLWRDPEYRKKMSERLKELWSDPDQRPKKVEGPSEEE